MSLRAKTRVGNPARKVIASMRITQARDRTVHTFRASTMYVVRLVLLPPNSAGKKGKE